MMKPFFGTASLRGRWAMQKYQAIVRDIRYKITSGSYVQGDRLPTTAELCDEYGVSKITVKRAMDDLVALGLVARRRGSGTYVKGIEGRSTLTGSSNASQQMNGLVNDGDVLGQPVTSDVHQFMVVQPPADIATLLNMEQDEFAYYVCRTRFLGGSPHSVEHTYMPLKLVPDLRVKNVNGSIYRYIEDDLGLKIASAHRVVCATHPADEEAMWLGIDTNTPIIEVRQVGYLDDGTPFEVSTVDHAPGYEFFSVSTKGQL